MDKKILAIVNPVSAGGKTAKLWLKKKEIFKQEFNNFSYKHTAEKGDAVKIAADAVKNKVDYIMAVGGDGTINEIINGMLLAAGNQELKTALIIYSQGTGSDLNRTLNLPINTSDLINLIKKEETKAIKILQAKFLNLKGTSEKRYFINIADCGFGAEVAKKINTGAKKLNGSSNYLLKIFQTLFSYQNLKMKIKVDNNLFYDEKFASVVVANGSYFGGGVKIAPEADLFADKLNLVLLKDFSKIKIVFNLLKAYKAKHLSHPLVESITADKVEIFPTKSSALELDGESFEIKKAEFKVYSKRVNIIFDFS